MIAVGYDPIACLSFAKVSLSVSTNEDRCFFNLAKGESSNSNEISCFGVCDGHGGSLAAEQCSSEISEKVRSRYNELQQSSREHFSTLYRDLQPASKILRMEDVNSAALCQSINETVVSIHQEIIQNTDSGTTLTSLFLTPTPTAWSPNPPPGGQGSTTWGDAVAREQGISLQDVGRSYQVHCANVGDSRCVMVSCAAKSSTDNAENSSPASESLHSTHAAVVTFTNSLNRSTSATPPSPGTPASDTPRTTQIISGPNGAHDAFSNLLSNSSAVKSDLVDYERETDRVDSFDLMEREQAKEAQRIFADLDGQDLEALGEQADRVRADSAASVPFLWNSRRQKTVQVRVRLQEMSEDHGLKCVRELQRIVHGQAVAPLQLAVPLKASGSEGQTETEADYLHLALLRRNLSDTSVRPRVDSNSLLNSSNGAANAVRRASDAEAVDRAVRGGNGAASGLDLMAATNSLVRRLAPLPALPETIPLIDRAYYWRWSESSAQLLLDDNSPIVNEGTVDPIYRRRLALASRLMRDVLAARGKPGVVPPPGFVAPSLIEVRRAHSCIAKRKTRDGRAIGPVAFFGRGDHSLLMTRSIGDRVGPESAIPLPDITTVTVHATQHARFVLASDGMWDVLSCEDVRQSALLFRNREPVDLAYYLAAKAKSRRDRYEWRPDDITVMVVDVNPQHAVFIDREKGKGSKFYDAFYPDAADRKTPLKISLLAVDLSQRSIVGKRDLNLPCRVNRATIIPSENSSWENFDESSRDPRVSFCTVQEFRNKASCTIC